MFILEEIFYMNFLSVVSPLCGASLPLVLA